MRVGSFVGIAVGDLVGAMDGFKVGMVVGFELDLWLDFLMVRQRDSTLNCLWESYLDLSLGFVWLWNLVELLDIMLV